MLNKVVVENYKNLAEFSMDFAESPCAFISGENGSGKSTLFEVLTLIREVSALGSALVDDTGAFRVMGRTITRWKPEAKHQSFVLTMTLDGAKYHHRLVFDAATPLGRPRIHHEHLECDGVPLYDCREGKLTIYNDAGNPKVNFHVDWEKSFMASIAERPENTKLIRFRKGLLRLLYVRPNPFVMTSTSPYEVTYPEQDLRNFVSWLRHLKQSGSDDHYNELLEKLNLVIPGLCSLTLADVGDRAKELLVEIKAAEQIPRLRYAFSELSEGQRLLIALYTVLTFETKGGAILCLDEPDNFLSIAEVAPLIATIQDCCDENVALQVIVASHHPEFYKRIGLNHGYVFTASPSESVVAYRMNKLLRNEAAVLPVDEIFARGWEGR